MLTRWDADSSESAAWDARALIDEISKAGRSDEAIKLGEQAMEKWPDFAPLGSCLGWAYYRRDISGITRDSVSDSLGQARRALTRIIEVTSADPFGKFSPRPMATIRVARALVARKPSDAVQLLESLNPDHLSTESGAFRSLYSQWLTLLVKALADSRQWPAVLDFTYLVRDTPYLGAVDLESICWHRVRALEALDRNEDAITLLLSLRHTRSTWYFDACYARLLEKTGSNESALNMARQTMNHPGDLAPRWGTCVQIGLLLRKEFHELAADHLLFASALRTPRGWKVDEELSDALTGMVELTDGDLPGVERRLRADWRTVREATQSSGVVKAVLPGGGSGFITDDDGTEIYFSMGRNGGDAPPVGTRVRFRVVESFDTKKRQASTRAISVRTVG